MNRSDFNDLFTRGDFSFGIALNETIKFSVKTYALLKNS